MSAILKHDATSNGFSMFCCPSAAAWTWSLAGRRSKTASFGGDWPDWFELAAARREWRKAKKALVKAIDDLPRDIRVQMRAEVA